MKAPCPTPYYIYPAMLRLKTQHADLHPDVVSALKTHIALNTADPSAAAMFVDLDGDDWANIYPAAEAPQAPATDSAIDTFLNTYGHTSPGEEALLEKLIFNPTPDYSEVLAAEEQKAAAVSSPEPADEDVAAPAADAQSAAIDAFISSHPAAPQAHKPNPEPEPEPRPKTEAHKVPQQHAPKTTLSESLAKIFIKQGRYERAYEIISDLNLKNPEKSVYFADQLRFLQKLIELQKGRANRGR